MIIFCYWIYRLILFYLLGLSYYLAGSIAVLGEDVLFDLSMYLYSFSDSVIKSQKKFLLIK